MQKQKIILGKQRTHFIFFLLISVATSFAFCKIQTSPDRSDEKSKAIGFGKEVHRLDAKARLVFQDSKQNYWFASEDVGVYRFDGSVLHRFTPKDGLCGLRILSVQEDSVGNLYFDTPDGVSKFDGKKFNTLKIAEDETKSVWKSEPRDMWFRMGWSKNGPYRYDGEKLYHVPFPKCDAEREFRVEYPTTSFDPYGIYSMYKDREGNYWFGTSNMGLFCFDGEKIRWMHEKHLVDTPDGGNFCIRSIAQDQDGYFWISNSRYRFKMFTNYLSKDGNIRLPYGIEDGVIEDWKDVLYFSTIISDPKGNLWMQNADGLWKFDGKERIRFWINDGTKDIAPTSVFVDNQGLIWLGTEADGMYTFDGSIFEKLSIQ